MSQTTNQQIPSTAVALLGLLTICPASGYELKQLADTSISHFYWTPAKSQIYSELRRLTSLGLATEQLVEQNSRPDKRTYSITDEGRTVLTQHLESGELEREVVKSPAILRVFFGGSMSNNSLIEYIERYREQAQTQLELMSTIRTQADPDGSSVHTGLAIRAGELSAEFNIKWADEVIEALSNLENGDSQ